MNTNKIGALTFLDLILILAFAGLNAEMATVAAGGSGAIYTLLALLFPYFMIVAILIIGAGVIYEVLK